MRRFTGAVVLLALAVAMSLVASPDGTEAGQPASPAIEVGACGLTAPALGTTAARPCIIRCSDLTGCQRCCVIKGGWVCT